MTKDTGSREGTAEVGSPDTAASKTNPTVDFQPSSNDVSTDAPFLNTDDTKPPTTSVSSEPLWQFSTTPCNTDNGPSHQHPESGPFCDPDPAGIAGDDMATYFQSTNQADEAFLASNDMSNLDFDMIDAYVSSELCNNNKAVAASGLEHASAPSKEDLSAYDISALAQLAGDSPELAHSAVPISNMGCLGDFLPSGGMIPISVDNQYLPQERDGLLASHGFGAEKAEDTSVPYVPNAHDSSTQDNRMQPRTESSAAGTSDQASQLFCSDNEEAGPSIRKPASKTPAAPNNQKSRKRLGPTKLSAAEKRQKLLDSFNYSQDKTQTGKKPRKPQIQRKRNLDPSTLIGWKTTNAAKAAKARADAEGRSKPLSFTSKRRDTAITEMISQAQGLDEETMKMDKRALSEACTLFNKPPRADGKGGWCHPDMNTSLFHYQLLGAGFMRTRENSVAAPHGGFLCDDMGFGKTIQAIANMVDGTAAKDDPIKTTLIVAPPHLVNHWKKEILEHAKKEVVKMVVAYHAKHRPDDDMIEQLVASGQLGVLITTYGEVRRSYPEVTQSPASVVGRDLQTMYDKHCGILHKIKFRRIIIDEGHEIKNHASKTSRAVRSLSGRFRWVITGTPVHNHVNEFFPYFDFTRVPHTGTFEQFRKKYSPDNEEDLKALTHILRYYMFRRTHEDTLFGHPILKMPDIEEQTCEVLLCKAERHLYRELMVRCISELFDLARRKEGDRIFRSYLTLLLRLRMFTSHALVASKDALKDLLTVDMIRSIRTEIIDEAEPEDLETCYIYEKLVRGEKLPTFEELLQSRPLWARGILNYGPRQRSLITRFRTKLNAAETPELQAESLAMTRCKKCNSEPFDGYITSCMHVTCHPCYLTLNRKKNAEQKCGCGETTTDVAFYHTIESLREEIPVKPNPPRLSTVQTGTEIVQNDIDWVDAAGHIVKGGKLKAVRYCVCEWFSKSRDVKVVLFTQFLGMVKILAAMCESEGWGFTTLTGHTPPMERDRDIQQFRDDPDTRVLISSLKAGGTGLSLTMATRCILVDLWWNEAIEQQAFCRLYRIGQENGVEFVRLTAKDTIDDRLQEIQQDKAEKIDKTMGPEALSAQDAMDNMLKLCNMRVEVHSDGKVEFLDCEVNNSGDKDAEVGEDGEDGEGDNDGDDGDEEGDDGLHEDDGDDAPNN